MTYFLNWFGSTVLIEPVEKPRIVFTRSDAAISLGGVGYLARGLDYPLIDQPPEANISNILASCNLNQRSDFQLVINRIKLYLQVGEALVRLLSRAFKILLLTGRNHPSSFDRLN